MFGTLEWLEEVDLVSSCVSSASPESWIVKLLLLLFAVWLNDFVRGKVNHAIYYYYYDFALF